jgi:hypothetical protein
MHARCARQALGLKLVGSEAAAAAAVGETEQGGAHADALPRQEANGQRELGGDGGQQRQRHCLVGWMRNRKSGKAGWALALQRCCCRGRVRRGPGEGAAQESEEVGGGSRQGSAAARLQLGRGRAGARASVVMWRRRDMVSSTRIKEAAVAAWSVGSVVCCSPRY